LTKDEILHIYSGGVLNVRIRGKEAEASIELSSSDAGSALKPSRRNSDRLSFFEDVEEILVGMDGKRKTQYGRLSP
jgi:hypothetical protein